jgi:hypothetical protein
MRRIHVLGSWPAAALSRLRRSIEARGAELDHCGLSSLAVDERLATCEVLLLTSPHLCLLNAGVLARQRGARVLPDPDLLRIVGHKLELHLLLRRLGFRTPEIVMGTPLNVRAHLREEDLPALARSLRRACVPVAEIDRLDALEGDDVHVVFPCTAGERYPVFFVGEHCWSESEEEVPSDVEALLVDWRDASASPFGRLDVLRPSGGGPLLVVDADLSPPSNGPTRALEALVAALLDRS